MEPINSWGYHLIINAGKASIEKISNHKVVYDFSKQVVKDIDMVPYGEPQIVNFGSGNKQGFTLVQLIETSNIVAHFCNENGDFYLDVFSCKDFDPDVVIELAKKYFSPSTIEASFITRQAK